MQLRSCETQARPITSNMLTTKVSSNSKRLEVLSVIICSREYWVEPNHVFFHTTRGAGNALNLPITLYTLAKHTTPQSTKRSAHVCGFYLFQVPYWS